MMMDLAEYLQAEVDKARSIRKVAAHIGISKTTLDNIIKRRLKGMPELPTLDKIAKTYNLTVPAVVEMAGMMLGDVEKYVALARKLEQSPWIARRFDDLLRLNETEFNYWLDWVAWNGRQKTRNGPSPDPPIQ